MKLRTILTVGTMLGLSACSSKPAADLYVLRTPDTAPQQVCTFTRNITLDRPSAPQEYDTKRIAILLDHNHLSYYTGANWASPFPDQLQDFMNDALTQRGLNVLDGDAADAATALRIVIREANVTQVNAPVVRLRLTGSIGKKRFKVNESVPASENHMPQIIEAYDEAASNAVDTIVKAIKVRCPAIPAGD